MNSCLTYGINDICVQINCFKMMFQYFFWCSWHHCKPDQVSQKCTIVKSSEIFQEINRRTITCSSELWTSTSLHAIYNTVKWLTIHHLKKGMFVYLLLLPDPPGWRVLLPELFSSTSTTFPCSSKRNVFASTSCNYIKHRKLA